MQTFWEDRLSIADLMTGWIHRDLAEWEKLRELFHPDGTIEITWFEGLASDFVDGSMRMGKSDFGTKHVIAAPVVTFNGNKAVVETNAVVIGENARLELASVRIPVSMIGSRSVRAYGRSPSANAFTTFATSTFLKVWLILTASVSKSIRANTRRSPIS
jgi:hypothetical protein